jgi:hypothetical protein
MTYRMPYPLPGEWNPAGPFRNPGGTNPLPRPDNLPVACWFGSRQSLNWATGTLKIAQQATWSSPIFDMRPDMRGISGNVAGNGNVQSNAAGASNMASGVPIWNPSAQLWLQLESNNAEGLRSLDLRGFQVLATEQAHISNPNLLQSISGVQDITEEFSTLGTSSVLGWAPYGDGLPIRYYRLVLTFNIRANFDQAGSSPAMMATGAMY